MENKQFSKQEIVRRSLSRNMEYLKSAKDLQDLSHRHGVARGNARAFFDLGYLKNHDYRLILENINDIVTDLETSVPGISELSHRYATIHYAGFPPCSELQKVRFGFTIERITNPSIKGWLLSQYVNKRNICQHIISDESLERFSDCISALNECLKAQKKLV